MVPFSFGCGSAVFAAIATLAPSRAARSAIASPMPRLAPEMNSVLPLSVVMTKTPFCRGADSCVGVKNPAAGFAAVRRHPHASVDRIAQAQDRRLQDRNDGREMLE